MEEKISIEDLFKIIKTHLLRIFAWSLVGLIIASVYTFFVVTPMYESTAKIVVNQTQTSNQILSDYDIQTNLNLINTYQGLIREPIILEEVIHESEYDLTIDEMNDKLTFQTSNNSLIFGISVADENPYRASELANLTASVFNRKVKSILEVDSVKILSDAVPNFKPVSPYSTFNMAVGLMVGFMIGVGISFMKEFMDKRVKNKHIIEELGWVNLGSVLEMSKQELSGSRKESSYYVVQNEKPSLVEKKAMG